jgi:ABC-2 type transport system permease protein
MLDSMAFCMRRILAIARVSMRTNLLYRERWVSLLFTAFLPVSIAGMVLHTLVQAPNAGPFLRYLGEEGIDGYYIAIASITLLSQVLIHEQMSMHVREGTFSSYLLRPTSGTELLFGFLLGNIAFVWPFALGIGVLGWYVVGAPVAWLSVLHICMGIGILVLCILLQGVTSAIAGTASFWLVQTTGLFALIMLAINFFGGMILPLSLLPHALQRLAEVLPFRYFYALPASTLTNAQGAGSVIVGQLVWLLVLSIVLRTLWYMGLRRYDAAGG